MNTLEYRPGTTVQVLETLVNGAAGVTGKFPRLEIRDAAGAPVGGLVPLADVGIGLYSASFVAPATLGAYLLAVTFYDDAGFTTPTPGEDRRDSLLRVRDHVQELNTTPYANDIADGNIAQARAAAAMSAGLNTMLDQMTHNANNNLTGHRERLFPNAAGLIAATDGAADGLEGDVMRIKTEGTTGYSLGNQVTQAEVLDTFKRRGS